MSDRHPDGSEDSGAPVPKLIPRDMPDQQAGAEDPWEARDDPEQPTGQERPVPQTPDPDPEIPDTDGAGTGRRGAPHSGSGCPGHPVPDESPA